VHCFIKNDPRHEYERAAVLRGFVQHFSGDLPWLGVAGLPRKTRREFRRLANGADDRPVRYRDWIFEAAGQFI
jgi:hypothetical protein